MSRRARHDSSLFSELSEKRLGRSSRRRQDDEDDDVMAWHDEEPVNGSRRTSSSPNGSHVSLGNSRLSQPFDAKRIAIVTLISTLIVLLAISCTTLGIVLQERSKHDDEMQYIRSVLDEHLLSDRGGVHDDPPAQNTAPVATFQNGTNAPTLPPMESSSSPSPSAEPQIESEVPTTGDSESSEPPTASPTQSLTNQPTATPTEADFSPVAPFAGDEETQTPSSSNIGATPVPVQDTPAPFIDPTSSPVVVQGTPAPVVAQDTPVPFVDPTSSPVVEGTPAPFVDPTSSPVIQDTPAPFIDPTSSPVVDSSTPVGETVDCIGDYADFVQCTADSGGACGNCEVSFLDSYEAGADCDAFNTWFETNLDCCDDDECGFELDAFATCKNCPQGDSPVAPAASPGDGTLEPAVFPTGGDDDDDTAAPVVQPTASPVAGQTPAPVSTEWSQVGQDLTWSNPATNEVASVVISRDGTTAAVGQFESDANKQFGGQVDVYRIDENGFWSQLGPTIESDVNTGSFGYGISLSEDGEVIAISNPDDGSGTTGTIEVYGLQGEGDGVTWERRGQNLDGGGQDQFAGGNVVLSDDGTFIIYDIFITARQPGPTKFVRVFRYNGSNWEKVGQDVFGQVATLADKFSIDLSGDGTKFAMGATVPGFGYAETYELNGNTWEKYGEILPDSMTTDESVGMSVSLDQTGNTLAVGFQTFVNPNIVRAYSFDDEWVLLGEAIDSEGSASARTMTIDLSSDGQTLAIGPQDDTPFASVHMYDLSTNEWSKVGDNIDADLTTTVAQVRAISIANEGSRVAVFDLGAASVKVYDSPGAIAATSR